MSTASDTLMTFTDRSSHRYQLSPTDIFYIEADGRADAGLFSPDPPQFSYQLSRSGHTLPPNGSYGQWQPSARTREEVFVAEEISGYPEMIQILPSSSKSRAGTSSSNCSFPSSLIRVFPASPYWYN